MSSPKAAVEEPGIEEIPKKTHQGWWRKADLRKRKQDLEQDLEIQLKSETNIRSKRKLEGTPSTVAVEGGGGKI